MNGNIRQFISEICILTDRNITQLSTEKNEDGSCLVPKIMTSVTRSKHEYNTDLNVIGVFSCLLCLVREVLCAANNSCPSLFSIAVVKYSNQKRVGEKTIYFILQFSIKVHLHKSTSDD